MKLNHRQRITYRHCLKEANYWSQMVKWQQANFNGTANSATVNRANLWRDRFTHYYFKIHRSI